LFAKCSLFSMLPINEELTLGLRPTFLYTNNYASSKLFHLNTNADLEQPFLMLSVIGPKPNLHHFRITHQ